MTLWDVAVCTAIVMAWMACAAVSVWCIIDGIDQGNNWRTYNWRKVAVGSVGAFLVLGALGWLISSEPSPYCPKQCRSVLVTYVPTNATTIVPLYSETCDWACARRLDERR